MSLRPGPRASRPHRVLVAAARRSHDVSPFYRDHLASHLTADPAGAGADWAGMPFTTAADLLRAGVRMSAQRGVTSYASSGTSGSVKPAFFSGRDRAATVRRTTGSLIACGVVADDSLVVAHGFGIWLIGLDFAAAGEELGLRVVPLGKGPGIAHTLVLLRELGAEVIATSPGYARRLAEVVGYGEAAEALGVRKLLLSGEVVSPRLRTSLQAAWGVDCVHSFYGSAELGHLGCDPGADGLITLAPDFGYELLDGTSPLELRPGATGELVVTTLFQDGMPLVRYRTGDLVTIARADRNGPVTALVTRPLGRLAESVVLESGEKLWAWQIEEVLRTEPRIVDFRATLDEVAMHRQWFATGDRLDVLVSTQDDIPLTAPETERLVLAVQEMSLDMSAASGSIEIVVGWRPEAELTGRDGAGKPRRLVDRRKAAAEDGP